LVSYIQLISCRQDPSASAYLQRRVRYYGTAVESSVAALAAARFLDCVATGISSSERRTAPAGGKQAKMKITSEFKLAAAQPRRKRNLGIKP
jgi:hypothetical protein